MCTHVMSEESMRVEGLRWQRPASSHTRSTPPRCPVQMRFSASRCRVSTTGPAEEPSSSSVRPEARSCTHSLPFMSEAAYHHTCGAARVQLRGHK